MRHYLVVANQTLGGDHLAEKVKECLATGPCDFHVVVPATHPKEHATYTEGKANAIAQSRLEAALARFRELGAKAEGEVGDASPMLAIRDALIGRSFDELILSTLPPGPSRWLKQDLPHRVERTFSFPVTHVVAPHDTVAPG
jgi:cell pole-organizing protein PopZ